MNITDKIRELCKKEGISMTELEKQLNFGNGSLTKSDNENIKLSRLRSVAKFFKVSLYYFFDEDYLVEKQLEEYENDKLVTYLMTTPIFVEFCDQYRRKDGDNIMELFDEYAKQDARYSEYKDNFFAIYNDVNHFSE